MKLKGWRASRAIIRWSRSDEVRSERLIAAQTDDLVHELRELALGATREGHQLYMWIDVDERAMF